MFGLRHVPAFAAVTAVVVITASVAPIAAGAVRLFTGDYGMVTFPSGPCAN